MLDASQYGTLMLVDTEDAFRPEEVSKIKEDVRNGLSIVVLAEWYNEGVMKKIKFFDDNTQLWWTPQTGGGHVPGLNDLLSPFGIAFSNGVWKGSFNLGTHAANIKSGTSIVGFPQGGTLHFSQLQDEALSLLSGKAVLKSSQ